MVCKRRRKRLYTFVMAINAAIWIFFLSISWSCCEDTRQQYILDYTIVDSDSGGLQIVDEAIYQRDILEDADAHFALYHKDDTHRVRRPLLSGIGQGLAQRSNENAFLPSNSDDYGRLQDGQMNMSPQSRIGKQQSVIGIGSDNSRKADGSDSKKTVVSAKIQNTVVSSDLTSSPQKDNVKLADILRSNIVHNNNVYPPKSGEVIGRMVGHQMVDEDQVTGEKKRLPQAVIIGVKKGGTRALLEYLKMHPDVKAPGPEPHFFDKNYDKGYQWYRDQMPNSLPGQITIEKTPSYFITKEVPGRMYSMSPDLRLIVVVRDPVTRAVSDYAQGLDRRPDLKPFEQMAFLDNSTEIVNTSWGAIKIGLYVSHLEKWLKHFKMEQIYFVDGERLISQPAQEMYRVQEFLNIRQFINETHFSLDAGKGFPCMKKPWGQGRVHCLDKTKGRAHPLVKTKAIQRLQEFYKPFNEKLTDILGQSFGW